MSTIGVKGSEGLAQAFVERDLDIGQIHKNPYSRSKFLAEAYVREYCSQGGKASVYRAGTIGPESQNGLFQRRPLAHFFVRFLRGVVRIGASYHWSGRQVALMPVDEMARAILTLADYSDLDGQTFHLFSEWATPYSGWVALLRLLGYSIKELVEEDFRLHLATLPPNSEYADAVGEVLPMLEPRRTQAKLQDADSRKVFTRLGLDLKDPGEEWKMRFLQHLNHQGVFDSRYLG